MTRERFEGLYFGWMCWTIEDRSRSPKTYKKLLRRLHEIPFRYSLDMDGNRETDGIELRYRFGDEGGYEDYLVANYLDDKPCSMLEMMTALCIRCEESIMDGYPLDRLPSIDTFSEFLFGVMLDNLGISNMDDRNFDIDIVDEAVERFLERDYEPNGNGGLFALKRPRRDMRGVEIWYQMCWYLDEILGEEV